MLTWQAHDGRGFEGVRVHFGAGKAFRALGRIVRAEPGGDWTASYRLVLNEDGGVQRASFTTATAERERHLTLNRTEDGFWLIDTGAGGLRTDFSGSIDIDLAGSVTFDALPVRRLDLHTRSGRAHAAGGAHLAAHAGAVGGGTHLPRHLTDEGALIELSSELGTAELRVDHDGFVIDHSVQATRVTPQPAG